MSGLGHGGVGEEVAGRSGEGLPESRPRKVGQGHGSCLISETGGRWVKPHFLRAETGSVSCLRQAQ